MLIELVSPMRDLPNQVLRTLSSFGLMNLLNSMYYLNAIKLKLC